jgi:hypothetical protein
MPVMKSSNAEPRASIFDDSSHRRLFARGTRIHEPRGPEVCWRVAPGRELRIVGQARRVGGKGGGLR